MNALADLMGEEGPTGPHGWGEWQVKRGWASLVSIESPLVLFAARWACPPLILWNSGDIPMWSVLSSQLTHRNPFSALPPPTLSLQDHTLEGKSLTFHYESQRRDEPGPALERPRLPKRWEG